MNKIITASGDTYDTDYFVVMPNLPICYLRVLNLPIERVREVFSNPKETSCLICGDKKIFGYIKLKDIFQEGDGVKVMLKK